MFTRSHLEEMKRRYASIYAPPVEEEVIEDGTIEGVNRYRKDTPGQGEEVEEHCGVCGQGIKEDEIDEGAGYSPEIKKLEDSIRDAIDHIQQLKKAPDGGDEYEIQDIRDRIKKKQQKIKDLRSANIAKKKPEKSGPDLSKHQGLTGHRGESVEVAESFELQVKMALDDVE